jgi:hypothetical protein
MDLINMKNSTNCEKFSINDLKITSNILLTKGLLTKKVRV